MATAALGNPPDPFRGRVLLIEEAKKLLAKHPLKEDAVVLMENLLFGAKKGSELHIALCAFAAEAAVREVICRTRHTPDEPPPGLRVRDGKDEKYRPTPYTEDQRRGHDKAMQAVFHKHEFRLHDNTSIWKATGSKMDVDISIRTGMTKGNMIGLMYLREVRKLVRDDKTPEDMKLTDDQLDQIYKDAQTKSFSILQKHF